VRDGLRVSFALNEFVVGAVCVMVSLCTVGYLYTHMPPKPAPAPAVACAPKEPEVTIESIVYFIPVPAPKVNVKVIVPPAKKEYFGEDDGDGTAAPKPNSVQPESDDSGARALKLAKADPVFPHRKPIIPPALRQPIQR
jgi:hypothetical protein